MDGGRSLFRIDPQGPAAAYKTYAVDVRPDAYRPATCAETDCPAYLRGWATEVDEASTLGAMQAHYVRVESGRRFVEDRTDDGTTRFVFEAGQQCFGEHRTRLEEVPAVYSVRGGDWRGNPRGEHRIHARPEDWVEDFAEHQERVADALKRG